MNDPVATRVRYVEFTSRQGRPRPRGVEFLIIDDCVFQVVDGEVKSRTDRRAADTLAAEILEHIPPEDRTTDYLLNLARRLYS